MEEARAVYQMLNLRHRVLSGAVVSTVVSVPGSNPGLFSVDCGVCILPVPASVAVLFFRDSRHLPLLLGCTKCTKESRTRMVIKTELSQIPESMVLM